MDINCESVESRTLHSTFFMVVLNSCEIMVRTRQYFNSALQETKINIIIKKVQETVEKTKHKAFRCTLDWQ